MDDWSAVDLARNAHLSRPTVARALNERPVHAATLRQSVNALKAHEPVDGIDNYI
jgi:DNA-binding LacI/PurR family transcriptional regulator